MKKTVISVLSALTGAALGAGAAGKVSADKTQRMKSMSDKHLALFLMMNQWVKVKQEGKSLATYAGETLIGELKESGINILYGIDKNADSLYADVDIVSMDDELEPVDAVVVTAITFFDEIAGQLSGKMDCPVISLEDILYEV